MQYTEGQIGRVFVVRIDDGEDMLLALRQFVLDKNILAGSIHFLGALMNGRMVTGPEEPVIPPVPHFVMFEGGWEVFGVGTIYPGEDGPHIHYHGSVGRSGHALTGCLRDKAITYLIVEAVIMEFMGLSARREFDQKMQIHLPVFGIPDTADEKQKKIDAAWEEKKDAGAPRKDSGVPGSSKDEKENADDLPGGLAEIIRDLTRRPSG